MADVGSTDYLKAIGAGGGFDTKAIVTALVNAEKATKQAAIDRRTKDVDASVSGMSQLKSSLATLQTAMKRVDDKTDFNFSTVTNSAPTSLTTNFDASTALPGTYKVTVSQLAQNDVYQTNAVSDVLEVDTYTLGAAVASGGSASFTFGGTTYTQAYSVSASNTIVLLAAKINAASDITVAAVSGSGVAFTITSDVASDTQMTKGTIGGTTDGSTALTISTADTTTGSDGNKIQSAQNATISVNGLSVSSSTNQIDAVVPGLKLNLMETTSSAVVLSVGRDTTVAKAAITGLVDAYNTFEGVIKGLTASGSATADEGSLKTDASVKAIRSKMRDFLTSASSTPGATKQKMLDIGISLQRNGTFKVNQTTLGTALTDYYSDVTKMFSANTDDQTTVGTASRGIAGDLENLIAGYLGYKGLVDVRAVSYAKTAAVLKIDQTALDTKMESVEARYTKRFSTMSKIMDEMKSTQEYLKSSLDNLPFTSNND